MFRNTISETPFTTNIANECFPNITGDSYRGDTSFLASLRALIAPRISEDERVYLRFASTDYSTSGISSSARKNVTVVYEDAYVSDGEITIHSFNNTSDNNKAWLDEMKKSFTKVYKNYVMIEKFTVFFSRAFYTLCFVDVEHKRVVIFVDALDMVAMHYLQLSIPVFLPWYFGEGKEINQESPEYGLLDSFKKKTPDAYLEILNVLAQPYDFRTAKIKTLLRDFETRHERAERENIRNQISSILDDIDRYNSTIGDLLRQKTDKEIRLLGLEAKIEEGGEESEIMDFFICNKNISLDSVEDDGNMYFTVKGTLENFDEDAAERYIENDTSFVYRPNGRACNNYIEADDMKRLMKAIFVDQILTVRVCAKYKFNISGNVSGLSSQSYSAEYNTYMPNPHIDYHSCMGGYIKIVNELLKDNNYIGALSQCIASCQSLNWYDSTVMGDFMRNLYGFPRHDVNNRCIELPDGTVVDPKQAIEWLNAQQEPTEPETTDNEPEDEADE